MPLATPELSASCAATPASAANVHPIAANDSPSASDPTTGSPKATSPAVTRAAITRSAPSVTTKLADNGARLPTAPEPSSSYRPVSSSARVCRMTVSAFAPATITAAKRPDRHALSPPMVGEDTGPSSATNPGLFTI